MQPSCKLPWRLPCAVVHPDDAASLRFVSGDALHHSQQPLHVTDGVGAAPVAPGGVIVQMRHVVVEQEAGESAVPQRQQRLGGIVIALADETLLKCGHGSLHIAEVNVENPAARPEVLDYFHHVRCATRHLRTAAQAEIKSPVSYTH